MIPLDGWMDGWEGYLVLDGGRDLGWYGMVYRTYMITWVRDFLISVFVKISVAKRPTNTVFNLRLQLLIGEKAVGSVQLQL